jgi:thiol-disulfide isomerase/thioredoxin
MKRTIFLILTLSFGLLCTGIFSCNKNTRNNSSVVIKGDGFNDEFNKVSLKYFDHNKLTYQILETQFLTPDNTRFEFKIPFDNSNLYELNFDDKEFIPISVENTGTISIKRIGEKSRIKGSESTKRAVLFREQNDQLQAKYFGQLKVEFDKAMSENNQEKIQELTEQSEILIQDYLKEFRAVIIELGTTPAGFYALQFSDFNKELDFIEKRLAAFKKEAPNSDVTKALEKQVYQAKVTSIGNIPPPFESKTNTGELISLADYNGKLVLVDFWASWCRACRVENPKFVEIYEKYKPKNFEIISISQDESDDQWLKSIKKDGINKWAQIRDSDQSISKLYSISSLPQNILLDGSGKIIAKNISADDLKNILSE